MLYGIHARGISMKERITLQARVQVMAINGKTVEEIEAYAARFKSEYAIAAPEGVGIAFSSHMARIGWIIPLAAMAVHCATR